MVGLVDLRTRLFPWLEAKSERIRLLEGAARSGVANLSLPALPPVPRLYFDFDLEDNARLAPNACSAKFYGLASITVPQGRSRQKVPFGATLTGKSHGWEQFR
jgi:Asp-tRNA(Asn)/Glu-tRNA(Gln) amidotransferase A subunit family amidase